MRISTLHRRIIAALSLLPALAATVYAQVLDLDTLDFYPAGANALNSSGVAAGFYSDAGNAPQAFRYTQGGGMQALGDLGGTVTSTAYGINNSGVIVGEAGAVGGTEAFRWTSVDEMQSLGTLGGANSVAYAVNDSGTIVGSSDTAIPSDREAFVWTSVNGMTTLGTLGGNFSEARGISASGVIVGSSLNGLGNERAFLFNGGTMTDLLGVNAAGVSNAFGISGNRVVGSFVDGADTKPFLFDFSTGVFTDLTTVSGGEFFDDGFAEATAVNGSGMVVGTAQTSLGRRAWVYNANGSGAISDLNNALDPTTGGFDALTDGNAITEEGFIAGVGVVGGDNRAFITTVTIPEPSTASLLIGGAVGVAIAGGKRRRERRK